jgi:hypothetical protein
MSLMENLPSNNFYSSEHCIPGSSHMKLLSSSLINNNLNKNIKIKDAILSF